MKKGLINKVKREAEKRSGEFVKFFDIIYNEMCFDYRGAKVSWFTVTEKCIKLHRIYSHFIIMN